jgi:hypothetical protein
MAPRVTLEFSQCSNRRLANAANSSGILVKRETGASASARNLTLHSRCENSLRGGSSISRFGSRLKETSQDEFLGFENGAPRRDRRPESGDRKESRTQPNPGESNHSRAFWVLGKSSNSEGVPVVAMVKKNSVAAAAPPLIVSKSGGDAASTLSRRHACDGKSSRRRGWTVPKNG